MCAVLLLLLPADRAAAAPPPPTSRPHPAACLAGCCCADVNSTLGGGGSVSAPLLRGMLAGRVYVKWPYLQEAEVRLRACVALVGIAVATHSPVH